MGLTSFEHWLGHTNSQLVDDIKQALTTGESALVRRYALAIPNLETRMVNYFVTKLGYDPLLDSLMEDKQKKKPSSAFAKTAETLSNSIQVSGAIIVFEEMSRSMESIDTLSR